MTTRPPAPVTTGFVFLLIILLIMLPLGYLYHWFSSRILQNPYSAKVLPSEASASSMALNIVDWFHLEMAFPPDPGEARWSVRWTAEQPWTSDDVPIEVVNQANTYFAKEAASFQDTDKVMRARPHVTDMTYWDLDWVMFSQMEGPRDSLSFAGNIVPRDDFYEVILPREYDEFKRGHLFGDLLDKWVKQGVIEVSLEPYDSTASVIMLEPFAHPNLARLDEEKREVLSVGRAGLGIAGELTIRLAPVADRMSRLFSFFAGVLLMLWVIGLMVSVIMIVRIRRQNREIGVLSESAP